MSRASESTIRTNPKKCTRAVIWRTVVGGTAFYGTFSGAFLIEHYGKQWLHWTLAPYISLLVVVTLAFMLLALFGGMIARFTGPKRQNAWQVMVDGISQIAKGNFRIRLDPEVLGTEGFDHPANQLIESINEMANELGQLEDLRQEFIANVSHELQSPLAAMAGFAQLLRTAYPPNGEEAPYLDIIHAESMRLSRLTENLLKLTSLESGYHPMHTVRHAVDSQIREAIIALEPLWSEKSLHLEVSLLSFQVLGDIDLLYQVWVNLLTNAIKFTPEHGDIILTGEARDRFISLTITDTGIGIPLEQQDRIFERFYKADSARTRTLSGSGLGLAIVKKIVDMHGGHITVESRPDLGTAITVHLPRTAPL